MMKARVFAAVVLMSVLIAVPMADAANNKVFSDGDNFSITGYTYNLTDFPLNGTNISVIVRDMNTWTQVMYNSTLTNESGYFNLNLTENASYMYQLSVVHTNNNTGSVDYVGQSVPAFSYNEFSMLSGTSYYLKAGGTIRINALNSSGDAIPFAYQIKDTKLGYPIAEDFDNTQTQVIVNVPRERNYSIMIYPTMGDNVNQFVPVSFDWSNFSATEDYTIDPLAGLSSYNATTKTLNKTFNVTESPARITGYVNFSGVDGWEELTVVPYLLEPGNMIYPTYGTLPFNTSAWFGSVVEYDLTTGFYNITLPYAPAETVKYILYAAGVNGTRYGSYRNLTVTGNQNNFNFSMYGLLGDSNIINMSDSMGGANRIVNTTKQEFRLVNATTNATLSQTGAHIEMTVDYSDYGAIKFTFMDDIAQTAAVANFSVPLINATGIEEINVFTFNGAPKRVSSRTAAQITANSNISISNFNPDDIDNTLESSDIFIELYKSNSTCDVPNPPSGCQYGSSDDMSSFNPFTIIMGGGAISFRMGTGNIEIHYVNVDMLASGPPDALFDSSQNETTSGDAFDAAIRFGSNGPTIYDYVLVALPYTEGSSSTTGLNETAEVNISIPTFYDEGWSTPIWNTSVNGTNATLLAGNYSHYSTYASQWNTLMGNVTCVTNVTQFNATNPCYINTTANQIWIRLPHFSGTQPTVTGSKITAAATATTPSTGNGGSSGAGGGGGVTTVTSATHAPALTGSSLETSETLQNAIRDALDIDELSDADIQDILDVSETVRGDTTLERSGVSKTGGTTITAKITYNGERAVTNFMFYDIVPKTFSESSGDITVTAEGATFTVVNTDPEYLFTYASVEPGETLEINYTLDRKIASSTAGLDSIIEDFSSELYAQGMEEEAVSIICNEGDTRCSGNDIEICADNAWVVQESCAYGCDEESLSCKPNPVTDYMIIIALVIIIAAFGVLFLLNAKKPPWKRSIPKRRK